MKRAFNKMVRWAWALALVLTTGACGTLWHSAKEVQGQVVDAETGKPLEGVIVVAQWVPYHYGIVAHAGGHRGSIHSYEALTDSEGRYVIPAWGPRLMPLMSTIKSGDPNLMFFKAGYVPFSAANTVREFGIPGHPNQRATPLGVSEWDGVVINLKPFRGSDSNYQDLLLRFGNGFQTENGEWREFPRTVWALEREDRRLRATLGGPLYLSVRIVDMRSLRPDEMEFLKRSEP